jgi:hypothetical protein
VLAAAAVTPGLRSKAVGRPGLAACTTGGNFAEEQFVMLLVTALIS